MQLRPTEKAILSAICYSDIFDFPLKENEIKKYAISESKLEISSDNLKHLINKRKIYSKQGYYFLPGRETIVAKRVEREEESFKKIKIAKRIAKILSFLSTIQFIGISGSLAMGNSDKNEDIDLFIISKEKTVWFTRLVCILILDILGKRRKKGVQNVSNKICLNMFLDERSLLLPNKKQNLYSAHEIMQMKQVFVRGGIYDDFLNSNTWIKKFLPYTFDFKDKNIKKNKTINFFYPLEIFSKYFQLLIMNKNRKKEIISDSLLAFHPDDVTSKILGEYENRLKRYII